MFKIEKYYKMITENNVLVTHQGMLNGDTIDLLLQFTEKKLINLNASKKIRKKIINIMIESLQNSYHYVNTFQNDDVLFQSPFFVITKEENFFNIHTGNCVLEDQANWLKKRLGQINEMDGEDLQSFYIQQLQSQQQTETKSGAGLGLVDMIRKAGDKYLYKFKNLKNGYILFMMQIKVSTHLI